jgi:curved DNA-binding protein CbpA
MSQLQYSLEILGFEKIEDVHADSLKKAFKVTVLKAHPDKGGHPDDFDKLLAAYVYLLETVDRLNGGRRT